jgi:predicted dienelactone hydrolase
MFSHGACGLPTQSTFLLPLIASYGYVVAAVPHPGNTILDPNCISESALVASAYERPPDILFVTDELLTANGDSGSPFYGAIDAARIGMSGHSFGGWTTYWVTALDPRFKVALIMAGAVPDGASSTAVPSMHLLGQIDSVTIGGTTNVERAHGYIDSAPPKFYVEIFNAGHFAFSDNCLPGAPECNPPATLTQAEAHEVVQRWALPFLQKYLKGDARYGAFLAPPAPAGVYLEAQP